MFQWYEGYKRRKAWRALRKVIGKNETPLLHQAMVLANIFEEKDVVQIDLWAQSKLSMYVHCLSAHSLVHTLNSTVQEYLSTHVVQAPLLLGGPATVRVDRWCRGGYHDGSEDAYSLYSAYKEASRHIETLCREVIKNEHEEYVNRRLQRVFNTFITLALQIGETCYGGSKT